MCTSVSEEINEGKLLSCRRCKKNLHHWQLEVDTVFFEVGERHTFRRIYGVLETQILSRDINRDDVARWEC